MRCELSVLILLALILVAANGASSIRVDPNKQLLIDEYGRYRVFHGVNVVYKIFPFYPPYNSDWDPLNSFNEQDAQNLQNWGFNVIRLFVSWKGFEGIQGEYNSTYLEQLWNIVNLCQQYNIQVLLDMHQDLMSEYYCGEGLPDWAVKQKNFPKPLHVKLERDSSGYPLQKDCHKKGFGDYYVTYDVERLSQDLLFNERNLADNLAEFWRVVALFFKGNTNIIGYEIINEPFGISAWEHPIDFLRIGYQNDEYFLPFYRKIHNSVRSVDNDTILFYEPTTTDILNGGFTENVGGPDYRDREVFSYHIYCPLVTKEGAPKIQWFCKMYDLYSISGKHDNVKKIKVGGFMTEFGALDNSTKSAEEVYRVTGIAGSFFHSWIYWQYKFYQDITTAAPDVGTEGFWNANGVFQSQKVKALSQPYAYAICGQPKETEFDTKTSKFTLTIIKNGLCKGQKTELYLSESFYYNSGFRVSFSGCDQCILTFVDGYRKNYYQILGFENLSDGSQFSVTVTPQ